MKNRKYKVVKNLPKPNEQILNSLNDFEKFKIKVNEVNPSEFPLKKKNFKNLYLGLSSALLVAIVLIYLNSNVGLDNTINEDYQVSLIQEASPILNKKYEVFNYYSGKADTFYTNEGSVIIFQNCKLQNKQKELVEGNVEIYYRQFNKAAEIALAGIPLNYDSAGNKFLFESNGMFEIFAKQNDSHLQLPLECPCKVLLATNSQDTKFNNYYLDTIAKNWDYLGPFTQESLSKPDWGKGSLKPSIDEFVEDDKLVNESKIPVLPPMPRQDNESLPNFKINTKSDDFPELEVFKGVQFEVEPNDAERSIPLFSRIWSSLDLISLKSGVLYLVKMKKFNRNQMLIESDSILVHPIIDNENYESELAKYKLLEKEYKIALKKKNEKIIEQELKNKLDREIAQKAQDDDRALNNQKLKAAFNVVMFGIYNSDHPIVANKREVQVYLNMDEKIEFKVSSIKNRELFHIIPSINSFIPNYLNGVSENKYKFLAKPFFTEGEKFFVVINNNSLAIWDLNYLLSFKNKSIINLDIKQARIIRNIKNNEEAVEFLSKN